MLSISDFRQITLSIGFRLPHCRHAPFHQLIYEMPRRLTAEIFFTMAIAADIIDISFLLFRDISLKI